jgi:hypothetical protein
MLRKAIIGFVLLVAAVTLVHMYKGSSAAFVQQAQQAQVAASSRPADLQHLKRPAVREACTKHSDWDIDTCQTMDEQKVMIGMTAEQVRMAWGNPTHINTTSGADHQHEQWVYGASARRDFIYLDDGVVRTIQDSR